MAVRHRSKSRGRGLSLRPIGKVSTMGQPTRPTQPSILSG